MKAITASRSIAAPVSEVFRTISDVRNFSKAVKHVTKVEFLTEQRTGAGTRFRETRVAGGREQSCVIEVAEYVENERVRMVSDAGGATWDTTFSVRAAGAGTELAMRMEAKPHGLLARMVNPLIRGMVAKHVEADLDSVKEHCEAGSEAG